jgi:hypothetical protein
MKVAFGWFISEKLLGKLLFLLIFVYQWKTKKSIYLKMSPTWFNVILNFVEDKILQHIEPWKLKRFCFKNRKIFQKKKKITTFSKSHNSQIHIAKVLLWKQRGNWMVVQLNTFSYPEVFLLKWWVKKILRCC